MSYTGDLPIDGQIVYLNSMKISVITAVLNRRDTLADAVRSLQAQSHENFEHVVMDAGSTDGSLEVLNRLADLRMSLTSEPDDGIYDALNKGMNRATGDVIGLMHSDDVFASPSVLELVARAFDDCDVDAVYGDLQYVSAKHPERVIRHWTAGEFSASKLKRGWMPPHPALYVRKSVVESWGGYDTSYQIAADYDAILRWFGTAKIRARYVPEVFVKMRVGGESNRSVERILQKSREDYRALRSNEVGGMAALAWKNLSKLGQFKAR
ncbi:MAG: glycosyltransferase family 2 protein [Anderseniella sp.]